MERADRAGLATLPWMGISSVCPYSKIMELYFHALGYHPKTEVVADGQSIIAGMVESAAGLIYVINSFLSPFAHQDAACLPSEVS